MELPPQYKNANFRFVLIGYKGKQPTEKQWTKVNNYAYNDKKLLFHIKRNENYGVLCGKGNLLVIDFDSRFYQSYIERQLPETFTVASGGKRLHHLYYIIDTPFPKFPITDNNDNTLADLQCIGGQVVGANCIHYSGNTYDIIKDVPIKTIKTEDLKNVIGKKWVTREIKTEYTGPELYTKPLSLDIREKLLVSEMLESIGVDTTINPCKCPFHEMNGVGNLSYDDEKGIWNCFHCLHPNTEIYTNNGVKNLIDINYKDILINKNGDFCEPILLKKNNKIHSNILKIETTVNHNPLYVSKDHGMYIIKDIVCPKRKNKVICKEDCHIYKYYKCKHKKFNKYKIEGKIGAYKITENDALIYPLRKNFIDIDYLDVSKLTMRKRKSDKWKEINILSIDDDMLWVMGMFCAEGSSSGRGIQFSLHRDENIYAEKIKSVFNKYGLYVSIFNRIGPRTKTVHISNVDIKEIFKRLFGDGCSNKKVPQFIKDLPVHKQKQFFNGVMDGDGYNNESIKVTSKQLIDDLFFIGINIKKYPILKEPTYPKNRKPTYSLHIGSGKNKLRRFYQKIEGIEYYIAPIKKITEEKNTTTLYDLTVTGNSPSFLTTSGIVGNCGRGGTVIHLWMYHKDISYIDALGELKMKLRL